MISPQYLAGLVDGEGCISIIKSKATKHRIGYRLFGRVDLTFGGGDDIIKWLKSKYGGYVHKVKKRRKYYKQIMCINLSSNQAKNLIEDILPYLIIKKKQAETLLEFLGSHEGKYVSDEDMFKQIRLYNKSIMMNSGDKSKILKIDKIRKKKPCAIRHNITYDELLELYWKKGMSQKEIAVYKGCARRTVKKWMKKYGVPRRTLREAIALKNMNRLALR